MRPCPSGHGRMRFAFNQGEAFIPPCISTNGTARRQKECVKPCYFRDYLVYAEFDNDVFPIYLNVGRTKNKTGYHLYDITNEIEDIARRLNGVGRLREFLPKNGIFQNNYTTDSPKSLPFPEKNPGKFEKRSERVLFGSLFSGAGTVEKGLVYQMMDKEDGMQRKKLKKSRREGRKDRCACRGSRAPDHTSGVRERRKIKSNIPW